MGRDGWGGAGALLNRGIFLDRTDTTDGMRHNFRHFYSVNTFHSLSSKQRNEVELQLYCCLFIFTRLDIFLRLFLVTQIEAGPGHLSSLKYCRKDEI